MKKILLPLLGLMLFGCGHLFAQAKIQHDTAYLAILAIKNDSVRRHREIGYTVKLIQKKDPKEAIYTDLLLKEANASGSQKFLANVYAEFGSGYLRTSDYHIAYDYLLKALAILEKQDDWFSLIRVYQNMAWIQIQLKDENAKKSIENGLRVARAHNLKALEVELYAILGIFYDSHRQFDKAVATYKNSLALEDKSITAYSRASTYTNLGVTYRRSKRYDEAMESFLKALALANQIKDKKLFQSVYQNITELLVAKGDYDGAEKYIKLALANSKDNYEPVSRRGLYQNLKLVSQKKGDYDKALLYADSMMIMDKEVFAKDKVASVRELQTKYETAIKDQKIQQQNAENLQQKQLLVIDEKQAQIQKINFAHKQKEFKDDSVLQASLLQKNTLQARLYKQTSSAQIFEQNETIKGKNRFQVFLVIMIIAVLAITILIFYNQRKTKQLNKVILSQKDDLEKVNAVKDRMFSIIGHDLRSPINTLLAFNNLLEHQEPSAAQMKIYFAEIKKTLDGTASMMNNLLNWASSQMQGYRPHFQTCQLKPIANEIVHAIAAQAKQKNIVIKNEIPDELSIFADSNMTGLILRNLVTNAIKFTPQGGTVTLNGECTRTETRFSVSDTGVGLSPDMVMLFNSQQTDQLMKSSRGTNKEKGTGLGLLLCKTFAGLMNGTVTAQSTMGKGSRFEVSLPLA